MSPTAPKHPWIGLVVLIVICFAASGVGGAVTYPEIENWYAKLAKPSWTPPDSVFGPVWSAIYLSMAIAAWLVWRQRGVAGAFGPLTLFGVQLLLNTAWSWLFFGLHRPGAAFVDILLLWTAIAATWLFSGVDQPWRASCSYPTLLGSRLRASWISASGG
jgi:translocator protein